MSNLKEKLKTGKLTKGVYAVLSKIYNHKYKIMSDEEFAQKKYKQKMGIGLDLKNPKTFDEKLWWIKFNYHNPLITVCSDKYWVRDYVKLCGYADILVKLYGVYDSFDEIEFDKLPSRFFLKTTHGSGVNIIYDKNKPFDFKENRKKFNKSLNNNYYYVHREWGYKNIEPKIVCEEVLKDPERQVLLDYKLFCFGGKVKYVTVNLGSCHPDGTHRDTVDKNVYDRNFNYLPIRFSDTNFDPSKVKKPKNLKKMIEIAEKLSSPFPETRVDLYNIDGKIYFGELTFYHNGAYNDSEPEDFLLDMGKSIKIQNLNK